MSAESEFPQVEVSVAVLEREGLVLAEFSPNWKMFTLPMARPRRRPAVGGPIREEPLEAAVRAAAIALGRPLAPTSFPQPLPVVLPPHYQLSGRTQRTNRYTYHPFAGRVTDAPYPHALGWHTLWMKRRDFLTDRPVSPSAAFVIQHLREDLSGV
jgi:hypothetical protein